MLRMQVGERLKEENKKRALVTHRVFKPKPANFSLEKKYTTHERLVAQVPTGVKPSTGKPLPFPGDDRGLACAGVSALLRGVICHCDAANLHPPEPALSLAWASRGPARRCRGQRGADWRTGGGRFGAGQPARAGTATPGRDSLRDGYERSFF